MDDSEEKRPERRRTGLQELLRMVGMMTKKKMIAKTRTKRKRRKKMMKQRMTEFRGGHLDSERGEPSQEIED